MVNLRTEIERIKSFENPFWCITAEEVFDKTFDVDEDSVHLKTMVSEQYNNEINTKIELDCSQIENRIKGIIKDTIRNHRDFFCFKDIYGK